TPALAADAVAERRAPHRRRPALRVSVLDEHPRGREPRARGAAGAAAARALTTVRSGRPTRRTMGRCARRTQRRKERLTTLRRTHTLPASARLALAPP